jgi:hypothetical protein
MNLRDKIQPGWRVKIIDHDYLSDSRDDVRVESVTSDGLILRPRKPWTSQGRGYPTMHFTWGGDQEIDGDTVRLYRTATSITSRSMPGQRILTKTFAFAPPRDY